MIIFKQRGAFSQSLLRRAFSERSKNLSGAAPSLSQASPTSIADVPGLSSRCVKPLRAGSPVGPGATKDSAYKAPEYYLYNRGSYHEAEIEMLKYRCPQPVAK